MTSKGHSKVVADSANRKTVYDCLSVIVSIALSCIIFELFEAEEYRALQI